MAYSTDRDKLLAALLAPTPPPKRRFQIGVAVKQLLRRTLYTAHLRSPLFQRGIYTLTCSPTQATYVGSARRTFAQRWGQHINELENRTHHNARLQADWDRYGAATFRFDVTEIITDVTHILERERTILEQRAQYLPPIQNYNVAYSRVHPIPPMPEV